MGYTLGQGHRISIFISNEFGGCWKLKINVPGIVPFKGDEKIKCAASFEECFPKADYSREIVVNIGKQIAQANKWLWEDISLPKEDGIYEEFIDYETGESALNKLED